MVQSSNRIRPWHLVNTTIRTPFRLRSGLEALVAAGFEGAMDKSREEEMAWALHDAGVITLSETTTDVTSIARKWRSAFMKLGLIVPAKKIQVVGQGSEPKPYTLTENGRRLLAAKNLRAEQEVLLRAVSALRLPSPIEPDYKFSAFSPLSHVIKILVALSDCGAEQFISRLEMATIVMFSNGDIAIEDIVQRILALRKKRMEARSKRKFDSEELSRVASRYGQKPGTLNDYQDVNFRYLKATGLFQSRGRGITLVSEKQQVARELASIVTSETDDGDYFKRLFAGAVLPTDDKDGAKRAIDDLIAIAQEWNVDFSVDAEDLNDIKTASLVRHELEELIFRAKENAFAERQPGEIDEIIAYLRLLDSRKNSIEFGDEELRIRADEKPAYFEWILWRLLLALKGLQNSPDQVRRFGIDQDFLPVSTASGGGADVVGVYDDCCLVVEVTLTENSRQEAAEGEPVRRHVASVLEKLQPSGIDVYGLFVARKIDTNTAETFRIGVWYLAGDVRTSLNIVPLTIRQLIELLESAKTKNQLNHSFLFNVIRDVSTIRRKSSGAPEWKASIGDYVGGFRKDVIFDGN